MCSVMEELRNEGTKQGMQKFAELTKQLLALGRTNDLNRAIEDDKYRDKLMKELAIQQASNLLPTFVGSFLFDILTPYKYGSVF